MSERQQTISPVDGRVIAERRLADAGEISRLLDAAREAQAKWRRVPVAERGAICSAAVDAFVAKGTEIAEEISWQMGRPVAHSPGEVDGFEDRARYMISIADRALADLVVDPRPGIQRFIRHEPVGVVLVIAPWNYPYLTAVNSVVPALMAGNAVQQRHSAQTPLCAERFAEAFDAARLPAGVFQVLHAGHAATERMIAAAGVDHVAFTGSVGAGRAMQRAAADRFLGVGLELGGKDPAYVRSDADLEVAAPALVDGALFNAGQSCCGIERIYVDAALYDSFVERSLEEVLRYRLGNPLDPQVTLGPVVRSQAAEFVRDQVRDAVTSGARALVDPGAFPANASGTPYLAPQILVDVDHSMRVMTEESFGPVVGIMKVNGDDEAVALMNDSAFGLTASVWTQDLEAAVALGERVETGTWFMNRCDVLDPALAWTGVKDSGRGCTLSPLGFQALTRPKSFHLRVTSPPASSSPASSLRE